MMSLIQHIAIQHIQCIGYSAVADPGFPVGGMYPLGGVVDIRCVHFSPKMCAKMKEVGPIARPLDPPMQCYKGAM